MDSELLYLLAQQSTSGAGLFMTAWANGSSQTIVGNTVVGLNAVYDNDGNPNGFPSTIGGTYGLQSDGSIIVPVTGRYEIIINIGLASTASIYVSTGIHVGSSTSSALTLQGGSVLSSSTWGMKENSVLAANINAGQHVNMVGIGSGSGINLGGGTSFATSGTWMSVNYIGPT